MLTLRQITITFTDATNQANKLDNCAEELRHAAARMDMILNELRGGWDGDAANLYSAKYQELMRKVRRSSSDLEQIARVIRRSARSYYDAEKRNLEIIAAKNFTGGGGFGGGGGGGGAR